MLLRREGHCHGQNKTRRIYRELGLQLRSKTPKRRVKAKLRDDRRPATRSNETWAMDFVHDQLATGRKLRVLTIVNTFSRFSPALEPRFTFRGVDVVEVLERVGKQVGFPATIRVDQGTEFVSRDLDLWAYQRGVTLDFSRPGKPTDNAFIEAFNGRFRAECLNAHWFLSLPAIRSSASLHRQCNRSRRVLARFVCYERTGQVSGSFFVEFSDLFANFETRFVEGAGASIFCRIGGKGPPVLLLHGFPQCHIMWHRVAPILAKEFTVIAADLRGYGQSSIPPSEPPHFAFSKRAMARDVAEAMRRLGHKRFSIVGHDRGARVGYRLAFDQPELIDRIAVCDILPTWNYWQRLDRFEGLRIYHWMFLAQPYPLPETLIAGAPDAFLELKLARWTGDKTLNAFDPRALARYRAQLHDPQRLHALCEDYRAGAGPDVEDDEVDRAAGRRIAAPLLVLWGSAGIAHGATSPLTVWQDWATDVRGGPVDCGHFLPEENPEATLAALMPFLRGE